MAFADFPKIPEEYKPRVKHLSEKIKNNEITREEVKSNTLTTLGKVTIGAEGIKAEGDYGSFEVDSRSITAGKEFLLYFYELLPRLWGKQFLIKRGNSIRKYKIGLGLKKLRASEGDINNLRLPIVEFVEDTATKKTRVKVHRLEEFAAWLGEDWKGGSILFKLAVPASEFLTKEVLDKIDESMAPFCDQVFKKCGV